MCGKFHTCIYHKQHRVGTSKVITVNNDGNDRVECCVNGTCPCGSLHYALQHLTSNSIINNTSEFVVISTSTILIGSGNLHNNTLTGNDATVLCNHSATRFCTWKCYRNAPCRYLCNNYNVIVHCVMTP